MAVTLLNLRDSIRIELKDPNGFRWHDPEVDYFANQAYRSAFMEVEARLQNYFVKVAMMDIVAATREYALPADHVRTKMLEFVTQRITIPLKQRIRGVGVNYVGGIMYAPINTYPVYDFEGNNIVLEPTPLVSLPQSLRHTYYSTSTKLVNPGDTIHPDFKDLWVDRIVLEAAVACQSQTESTGAIVSSDLPARLAKVQALMQQSLAVRTLSPNKRRKRGYFE